MILENQNLKLLFDNSNGNFHLSGVINKRAGTLKFGRGSHDFIIGTKFGGKASELTAADFTVEDIEEQYAYTGEVNEDNRYVKSVKIVYRLRPKFVKLTGADFAVEVHYAPCDRTGTIKKHLVIDARADFFIDYIDFGSYELSSNIFTYSNKTPRKVPFIPPYITTLGQPVYADSVFMGLEFPTADNKVVKNKTCFRLCYQKMYSLIQKDGKIVTDTWVLGAAEKPGYIAVQRAFYNYIGKIAAAGASPEFRIQFNSWYDHMLDITPEKLNKSFNEVGKALVEAGCYMPDCFVCDDGWVDYQGRGFWEFDKKKFPNGLDEVCKNVYLNLKTGFGLWFSPRGGYTKQFDFAERLHKNHGMGINKQANDICVADINYVKALTDRMDELVTRYGITYLKLDGFAAAACKNPDHGHAVGGYNDTAFYTDVWKQWVASFEYLKKKHPKLFINLTSYSHPSPWFLQWADALWIGNSGDVGFEGGGSMAEKHITYRDMRYRDFYIERRYQVPSLYLYNHDPSYADKMYHEPFEYSYEEFTKFMYMNVFRGTFFHELYFSPDKFTAGRWGIVADSLKFCRYNFDVIGTAKFFGGNTSKFFGGSKVYGYMCGKDGKGLMIARNPDVKPQPFAIDQEMILSMFGEEGGYSVKEIYPKATSEITFGQGSGGYRSNLKPFEVKILQLKRDA